jgi:hypothetical protein
MQQALGGIAYDHIHTVNANHGWLARGLEKAQAEQLVAELKTAGHESVLKERGDLIRANEVLRVRRAELRDDALHVEVGLLGKLSPLPWESLSLVSIGRVQVAKTTTVKKTKRKVGLSKAGLAMGVPMPTLKKTTTTTTETELDEDLVLQLVFGEEGVVREFRPSHFDYGYLGDRLLPMARDNFILFLADLATYGKSAIWTAMARDLAESGKPPYAFQSDKDLLRFTQWRLEASFDLS